MAPNTGASTARVLSGPDARMSSWPASAGWRVPDTGASTNSTSERWSATLAASFCVARTPIVPICAQIGPCLSAASIP
jgi:hypothetical protein